MAIIRPAGRQTVLSAYVDFTYTDLTSGTAAACIDLPGGAVVVGGAVRIDTAFNSGTSDALVVGDADTANRYKTSFSIAATGLTALVPDGAPYTARGQVKITWTAVGTAATAGAGTLRVDYIRRGRANEVEKVV